MSQTNDCSEIIVSIGTSWGGVDVPLTFWMENGPGEKWYLSPYQTKCADDERELGVSKIPLAYRNDDLAQLLIALKVIDYPWDLSTLESLDVKVSELSERKSGRGLLTGEFSIQDAENSTQVINFSKFSVPLNNKLKPIIGQIFSEDRLFLFPKDKHLNKTIELDRDNLDDFVVSLGFAFLGISSVEYVREWFIPDESFCDSLQYGAYDGDPDTHYVKCISSQHQCSMVAVIHRITDPYYEVPLYWLMSMAIGHVDSSKALLDTLLEIKNSYTYKSSLPPLD